MAGKTDGVYFPNVLVYPSVTQNMPRSNCEASTGGVRPCPQITDGPSLPSPDPSPPRHPFSDGAEVETSLGEQQQGPEE